MKNNQTTFKQQRAGCSFPASEHCCHPTTQPSNSLQNIFKQKKKVRSVSNNELLLSKDATFKQPSNNLQTTFKLQKRGCTFQDTTTCCHRRMQLSSSLQATGKRLQSSSNKDLLPSKDATFKQPSNNFQTTFKQQKRGCAF